MILVMQDFDFAQILANFPKSNHFYPNFALILPKSNQIFPNLTKFAQKRAPRNVRLPSLDLLILTI